MGARVLALTILCLTASLSAQDQVAPAPRTEPAPAAEPMPVRRVVLYKTGVGYFEHLGTVRNTQDITIRFTSAQLDDALKSLTAIDLGKGQVTGISYNSVAPLERRLGALRLPIDQQTTMMQLLMSLRGARIEVSTGTTSRTGRLLNVEQRSLQRDGQLVHVQTFSVITDAGEMLTFELSPSVRVRLADRDLRQEVGRYLDVLGSTREQDVRSLTISTTGSGERRLFVSYISEVPIWKSSYRLIFPAKGNPLLQGWAIVDNTIGEDWRNVELSLVAGAPQSYIQELSRPYFGQRPRVPLPANVLLEPQTHGATLRSGPATVAGTVRDAAGAVISGVTVELSDPSGTVATAMTDTDGDYELAVPPGEYRVRVAVQGFREVVSTLRVTAGERQSADFALQVGSLSETVTITTDSLSSRARGAAGGVGGGVYRSSPPPPPPAAAAPSAAAAYEEMRQTSASADAADLGELFEYKIKEPISVQKNKSALVPIVSGEITAERVSLWKQATGSGRPLRAMWLTNTTGLTLDGGSMAIIDGDAFAGEGLMDPLKPGERRLVSYAADLGLLVSASTQDVPRRVSRVRVRDGILIQDVEQRSTTTYDIRSENKTPTTLVVEHQLRPGWKLAEGQKPAESTPGAERFRLVVDPGKEAKLAVTQISAGIARVQVGEVNDALIAQLAVSGVSAADLERAMRPVLEKKTELAGIDRRLAAIEAERARITADQQRLRENMKALRGTAEEKQLLLRYTRQLDTQETRLAELQEQAEKAAAERAAAMKELSRLIATVSFEWQGKLP